MTDLAELELLAAQTPQNYMRKPMPVSVMRFTGGSASAERIIRWLSSLQTIAYYRLAVGEVEDAVKIDKVGTVSLNNWIVSFGTSEKNPKGFLQIMNDENFYRRFETI